MRLAFRIDLNSIAPCSALCAAAVALTVLSTGVNAQEFAPSQSVTMAETADAGSATLTSTTLAVVASPDTTAPDSQLAGDVLSIPADAASVNYFSLDDQMLSRQRGGAVGMLMVAATPQLMGGNGGGGNVTLWDEIAPPSPLPIPIDAARAAQGNVVNYQRK
ncbi:hypothetical protein PQQ52_01490 [Paraburkholderia sediminicola]|uniref:hypothetical protein n=1 Tax=Paraburkholderia sediminicola TaxID=458836 RepID=UPI0038B9D334